MKSILLTTFLALAAAMNSHANTVGDTTKLVQQTWKSPEWAKNAVIYEINIRQYSPKGDLKFVEKDLPRLKSLGVDILWLMPIYPICEVNKKGSMGSPYAAYDFEAVNPKYGTLKDMKNFVKKAHKNGLKVILDFVPDHTGWESKWMKEHPEYFVKKDGKFTVPIDPESQKLTDWTDVAMLDYANPATRKAITNAHFFWVKECDVDGFREDVAGFVPADYWAELRQELNKLEKPLYMLSEWENEPKHFAQCFETNYGWTFHGLIKEVAKGKQPATAIDEYWVKDKAKFMGTTGWHMLFTQNHDENTWNGTLKESFGDSGDAFTAFTFVYDGQPVIYNGMEASLDKRLSFFEKDTIDWLGASKFDFFQRLCNLKNRNKAVWNGEYGGLVQKIKTDKDDKVFAFMREKDGNKVVCVFNFSNEPQKVTLQGASFVGEYVNTMNDQIQYLKQDKDLELKAWDYMILSSN